MNLKPGRTRQRTSPLVLLDLDRAGGDLHRLGAATMGGRYMSAVTSSGEIPQNGK
jgi:hypothetical protein